MYKQLAALTIFLISCLASATVLARSTPIELELDYYDCSHSAKPSCSSPELNLELIPYFDGQPTRATNALQEKQIISRRTNCNNGDIQSCADLAIALFNIEPVDNPEVLDLLIKACDGGDGWACGVMSEHSLYLADSSGPKYIAFYQHQAIKCSDGNQSACATQARLNALLPNVTPHKSIWFDQLKTACDADVSRACVNLSYMLSSDGVQTYLKLDQNLDQLKRSNRRRSRSYATRACDLGNPVGCWNAGLAYDDGIGVRQNWQTATHYFAKACKLNYFNACEELSAESYWKTGDPLKELEPACSNGDFNACLLVIEHKHQLSMPTADNETKTKRQAKYINDVYQICLRGSARACGNVAVLDRRNGNIARAERLASIACDRNQRHGCLVAGNIWKFHHDSKHHHKTANAYLQRACDLNSAAGCNNLGDSYRKGLGVEVNKNKAERLFTIACNAELAVACKNLSKP